MTAELNRRGIEWPSRNQTADSFCPHDPTPKQQAFLDLTCREAFYGGAAGGGKSDALLMGALQYADQPGYAALLLRRTFAQLSKPGALMDRANEWLRPTAARWRDTEKTWIFPSGAKLAFGYLQHEEDKRQYQSAEFQYIGFDELTEFTETMYTFLFSRLRRLEGVEIPLRMRSASNPGGMGHEWVKQRFLIEGERSGRIFVPARLDDNPYLDQEEYVGSLMELDPVTRAQLLSGDWEVRPEGKLFHRSWFEIVDAAPAVCRWVRYWDLAATAEKPGKDPDWTACALVGRSEEGLYYAQDVQRLRDTPRAVENLVRQTAALDGTKVAIRMEQEPGSSGVIVTDHFLRKVLPGFDFKGVKSTGDKVERARPVSSQAEAGNIKLVRGPWIGAFLDELTQFPQEGVHDDQVDALSGAMAELFKPREFQWESY